MTVEEALENSGLFCLWKTADHFPQAVWRKTWLVYRLFLGFPHKNPLLLLILLNITYYLYNYYYLTETRYYYAFYL